MTNHPGHEHLLTLSNPVSVYPDYNGAWKCDNCERNYNSDHRPYHCMLCSYDMCENCFETKGHVRHAHPLYYMKMQNIYPQFNGEWKCDGCGVAKRPPGEPCAYHCFHDQFDLCKDCFNGHRTQIHAHPLIPADATIVYNNSPGGLWVCDICRKTGIELRTQYSWHCSECEFDCCNLCLQEISIPDHMHPLRITDSHLIYPLYRGAWKCDMCGHDKNPGMTERNVTKPYHCHECQFDACHECIERVTTGLHRPYPPPGGMFRTAHSDNAQGTDVHGPAMIGNMRTSNTLNINHDPPVEWFDLEDDDNVVENLDDSEKCIVCLSKPKNATIVHQRTGHVCCCMRCALTLQRRGDNCPICRAHIDTVIRQYNS